VHITAKGLFRLLRRYPDALHVLDDIESVFRYAQAVEILRAALASPAGSMAIGLADEYGFPNTEGSLLVSCQAVAILAARLR
jgi:hypothetical protein